MHEIDFVTLTYRMISLMYLMQHLTTSVQSKLLLYVNYVVATMQDLVLWLAVKF